MNNENLTIDIIVNGKKAKVEIDKVSKATDELAENSKKAGNELDGVTKAITAGWVKVGAIVASATVTLGVAIGKASELSKATFGLSKSMKDYVEATSNANGLTQEMIAGFVQTGKSAGMSDGAIKKMIDTAIGLGRAFPHESVESFIDNLTMLNTSGEAQGYLVDILEQKWGTIDLKGKSLAEKMQVIEEATKGVNEEFKNVAGSKIDQIFTKANNAFTKFGDIALNMIDNWGWLDIVNEKMGDLIRSFKTIQQYNMKDVNYEISKLTEELKEAQKIEANAPLTSLNPFTTTKGEASANRRIIEQKLAQLNQRKELLNQEVLLEEETARKIEVIRQKTIRNEKAKEQAIINAQKAKEDNLKWVKEQEEEYWNFIKEIEEEEYKEQVERAKQAEQEKQKAMEETKRQHQGIVDEMSNAITGFVMGTKSSFSDMLRSIASSIINSQINKALSGILGVGQSDGILGSIGGWFSGLFNAHGNAFENGRVQAFATGGIVDKPTFFNHAGGAGVMGEAGTEAIMPLKRVGKDLGVKSKPSNVVLNIQNNTSQEISAEQISEMMRTNERGEEEKVVNIILKNLNTSSSFRNAIAGVK